MLAYVVLDGFDLGVGILFPFFPERQDRDVMTNSIAPVWDGNETWLVLGGGGLMAVFPLAYATILPALYMPIILMLLGLVFRGVAFEFRWRTKRWQAGLGLSASAVGSTRRRASCRASRSARWSRASRIADRAYAGGWWDWLTPFCRPHRRRAWSSATPCSAPPGSTSRRPARCRSGRAASRCSPASARWR